jgi:hypothetical protein
MTLARASGQCACDRLGIHDPRLRVGLVYAVSAARYCRILVCARSACPSNLRVSFEFTHKCTIHRPSTINPELGLYTEGTLQSNPPEPARVHRLTPRSSSRQRPLSLELLEGRLLLSWGESPPAATISVPVTAVEVALNNQGDAHGIATIARNEVDFYTFVAPQTGSYHVSTQTPYGNLDTILALFDSEGHRVAFNNDTVPGAVTSSDVSVELQAGDRVYFGVTNFTGSRTGSYHWLVDGPYDVPIQDDLFEENDSKAQAANLGTITETLAVSGLAMADSQDWFRFNLSGQGGDSSYVSIQFANSQGDLDLRLYDSAGRLRKSSERLSDSERISLSGLQAGTYYVQAFGFRGDMNPSYTLTIEPALVSLPPSPPGGFQIDLAFTGLTESQRAIFATAAARWSQVITGDLPNAQYNGITVDDVLIDVSSSSIDGPGGILGQAGPDRLRFGSLLVYHGSMQFDSADLASMELDGTLGDVILHEMGHVLGIGTIWTNLGLLQGASGDNPCFTGATATREYNAIFHEAASCVPVENTGGTVTRNIHWRESVFQNELMTGYVNTTGVAIPLSRVTAGSLRDLGYTVDLNAADSYAAPVVAAFARTRHRSARASLLAARER